MLGTLDESTEAYECPMMLLAGERRPSLCERFADPDDDLLGIGDTSCHRHVAAGSASRWSEEYERNL